MCTRSNERFFRLVPAFTILFLAAAVLFATGCASLQAERADAPPSEGVELQWGVVTNTPDDGDGFISQLVFRNRGDRVLPAEGWTLFFNFLRPIDTASVSPLVTIDHLNGDFYRLRPTEEFPALGPGSRTRITFRAGAWAASRSDAPAGFYFVWGDEEAGAIDPVGTPTILPLTEPEQTRRGAGDQLPVETPESRYRQNEALHELPEADVPHILPRPVRLEATGGTSTIEPDVRIAHAAGVAGEAAHLSEMLRDVLGIEPIVIEGAPGDDAAADVAAAADLTLRLDPSLGEEAYRLRIAETIDVTGGARAGVFYGIQSLRWLLPQQGRVDAEGSVVLPRVEIEDAPRFPYRGMHLDVARNFQDAETVKRLLSLMAAYKLNRFHFHLSDDEGWRVEIEELPELTEVGGRRGHTLSEDAHLQPSLGSGPDAAQAPGSGFYTREAFVDLLRHAHSLHIEVIPEIDLPGHARAAIVAMDARVRRTGDDAYRLVDPLDTSEYSSVQMYDDNVVDVCLPSTYRFIETVVDDLAEMYAEAGAPFRTVHTGGDEVPEGVWEGSPACERLFRSSNEVSDIDDLHDYFLRRFDAILDEHGVTTAGWEEIALTERGGQKMPNPAFVDAGFQPYVWNAVWGWGAEDTAYRLANAGYDVVLSNANTLYFDMAYAKHPEEPGYYWAGYVDEKTPFAFVPFDLYKSADRDLFGRPIPEDAYASAATLTMAGRENVLGMQGQLWSETVTSPERLEYMIFPRLISLAERAWAPRPDWVLIDDRERRRERLQADWNVFANAVARHHLPRLDALGVDYRIPPPGAIVENGLLRANTALPGLTIRYTTDGSTPTSDAPVYTGPVAVEGTIHLRTFTSNGRGSRTVEVTP